MFEIKTALSYLIPRKKQLSVSVVGLIAIAVISAIVWLILVFFSTTEGIERGWSKKISGVLGPLQILPSNTYKDSPFCQIDLYSHKAGNQALRLSEKAIQHRPAYDEELDPPLEKPLLTYLTSEPKNDLSLILQDLKTANIPYRFFESTICHLSIPNLGGSLRGGINFYSYVLGLESLNEPSFQIIDSLSASETEKILDLLCNDVEDKSLAERLSESIQSMDIVLTQDIEQNGHLLAKTDRTRATFLTPYKLSLSTPSGETITLTLPIKKRPFSVISSLGQKASRLPPLEYQKNLGYPVYLPKQQRQLGVRLLDQGVFEFASTSSFSSQSLTIPFFVAGFFDPGILPIGGKLALTSLKAVLAIQPQLETEGPLASSGIIIDTPFEEIPYTEKAVSHILKLHGNELFSLARYDQYETTKDLYQQLTSEKTLFRLISIIIVCVAASNIFSMLFILAHDRRHEIAILRALGTSKIRITIIFFLAGLFIGLIGVALGSLIATLTLFYLPEILNYISLLQGQPLLSESIYGTMESQTLGMEPLLFSFLTISLTSGLAGILAAIRACRANISDSLKG
jgi:lipoprotein-releasing system permease protein